MIMASTNETGHNKNVANFNAVYRILEEMGTLYHPTNAKLQLSNLSVIQENLQAAIADLNNKQPIYKNAVASRETAIAPLGKIMTKTLNYAKSLDISSIDKENVAVQAKKIRGDQKPKVINPETKETEGISTSQMSYDNRLANLSAFTSHLLSLSQYAPNEQEISIIELQALHSRLTNLSSAVNIAGNALITARKNRNDILYKDQANIIQLVRDIKAYLKSLGDTAKPYYTAVVKLKFSEADI